MRNARCMHALSRPRVYSFFCLLLATPFAYECLGVLCCNVYAVFYPVTLVQLAGAFLVARRDEGAAQCAAKMSEEKCAGGVCHVAQAGASVCCIVAHAFGTVTPRSSAAVSLKLSRCPRRWRGQHCPRCPSCGSARVFSGQGPKNDPRNADGNLLPKV